MLTVAEVIDELQRAGRPVDHRPGEQVVGSTCPCCSAEMAWGNVDGWRRWICHSPQCPSQADPSRIGHELHWAASRTWNGAPAPEPNDDQRPVFRLLTGDDLLDLPEPSWLIDGLVPSAGLTVLYGASGSGKSFLALDWALCVAEGLPWHGRDVEPRSVVYVAAEGRAGLGARYRAWLEARGRRTVERVRFLADAVNLLDNGEVDRARRTLETLPERPGLLVVDTMARTMVGGDENAAKDVGRFVHAVDALGDGGAALVVHHTGHEEGRERGSSALGAAADARLQLARDGRTPRLTLTNPKQKDAAEHGPVDLRLKPVGGSLALSLITTAEAVQAARAAAAELDEALVEALRLHGPTSGTKLAPIVRREKKLVLDRLRALDEAGRVRRKGSAWEPVLTVPEPPQNHPAEAPGGGGSEAGEEDVVLPPWEPPRALSTDPGSDDPEPPAPTTDGTP